MSNENEQPANPWEDEDETEITVRDPYLQASNQNRPQPRSGDSPQNTSEGIGRRPRPRGVPGSAHFYEEIESDEPSARPRPTRQSRAEVEARLRQRARQPIYTRDQEEPPRVRPAAQTRKPSPHASSRGTEDTGYAYPQPAPVPRPRPTRDFPATRTTHDFARDMPDQRIPEPYDEYDEYEVIEEREYQPFHKHERKHRRGGRMFSTLLTGCLGGLLTLIVVAGVLVFLVIHNTPLGQNLGVSKSTVNQSPQTQALTLGSATQLIIKDQAGNVTVHVDQNASTASLSSVKHVQASSQNDANSQFKQIKLSVRSIAQGVDPACLASTCLLINATTPTTSGGIFGGSNGDSIDLAVTLPTSFNSPIPSAPTIVTVSANAGNINVSSFNGVLNLNGNAGNINITHTLIFAGTCIQTLHGNITVTQESIFDLASPSKLVPCSNTVSSDPNRPWFNIKSGVGNLDITLTTNLDNLLLDANTNNGKITDDFNLNITSSDDSYTYHGPIVAHTSPTASLYIATSTGNIALHKQ